MSLNENRILTRDRREHRINKFILRVKKIPRVLNKYLILEQRIKKCKRKSYLINSIYYSFWQNGLTTVYIIESIGHLFIQNSLFQDQFFSLVIFPLIIFVSLSIRFLYRYFSPLLCITTILFTFNMSIKMKRNFKIQRFRKVV